MREILFKAKRLDNGEWVEGYLVKYPSAIQVGDCSPWYIQVPPVDPDDSGGVFNVDPSTVCQYTGQVDYESEEPIFCDDLLKSQSGKERIYVVGFEDGGYFARERGETGIGMPLTIENIGWSMLKRIGSIHDGEGGQ